jgi:capsular exopolysaccharide synthesis family protein
MSRVDEALRRAAATAGARDDRDDDAVDELRANTIEPSILDRYAVERPAATREAMPSRPAPLVAAPRVDDHVARSLSFNPALEGKLVVSQSMAPVAVEQYRRLAAVLHDHRLQHGLKTVMVSSSVVQEGKTLTISNLALTLSESYHQRVLLIDADLRRPAVHQVFGVANEMGLADVPRMGGARVPYVEISKCLSLLTAGRAVKNSLSILTSDPVRTTISEAATRFDWVLIDTPPVGILPDAQLVARLSDGVLFVIAAGATPYALVKRCIAELGEDRIVGTILNRVERRALPTDDYGGYYTEPER